MEKIIHYNDNIVTCIPFGHKSAQKCALLRSCIAKENLILHSFKYSLSAWRHLLIKNAHALSEVVGRALQVASGALK